MSQQNTLNAPKFLNLNTNTYNDERTLILLDNQDTYVNWSKWANVVIGLEGYKKWSQYKTNIVGIIITKTEFENSNKNWFEDLFHVSKKVAVIYISQKVLSLKSEEYWIENYDNLIHLENACNTYPYIQDEWEHTHGDALAIMSMIMRYRYIVHSENVSISKERLTILSDYGIQVNQKMIPNQCWLFLQYFKHSVNKRYREIKECLAKNCENDYIDKIVLITEKEYSAEWTRTRGSDKIQEIILGRRLTYTDFLRTVSDVAPDNCYVILANADIYFGESLKELWSVDMKNKMFALLRWDVPDGVNRESKAQLFGPRTDSQDSWIFLSDSIKQKNWGDYSKFNYQLGKPGCDNRFTSDILRMKFLVCNPALTLKSYHLHNSEVRNYSTSEYIPSDVYLCIEPTRILDMKQVATPTGQKPEYLDNESVEFEVKSSSVSNGITYCTMLEKEERFKWEPGVDNYYFDKIPIYNWKNACVSTNGLVYDLWNIYTGTHVKTHNYWEKTNVDIFTPLEGRLKVLAIPFENNSVFEKADVYCLEYLSRVARLLKEHPGASFWIPKEFVIFVRQFEWKSDKLAAIQYNPDVACYAQDVIGFLPGPHELGKEDIDSLRELYPLWMNQPVQESCVIIYDDILNEEIEDRIGELLGENWSITTVDSGKTGQFNEVVGAQLCIFIGGKKTKEKWSRLWALPRECCVIEFQQESDIDGEFQHLAHVAGLKSWVYLLGRANKSDKQQKILESIEKWLNKNRDELFSE